MTIEDKELSLDVLNGLPKRSENSTVARDALENAVEKFTYMLTKRHLIQEERWSEIRDSFHTRNDSSLFFLIVSFLIKEFIIRVLVLNTHSNVLSVAEQVILKRDAEVKILMQGHPVSPPENIAKQDAKSTLVSHEGGSLLSDQQTVFACLISKTFSISETGFQ